jgi:hypothetical protein
LHGPQVGAEYLLADAVGQKDREVVDLSANVRNGFTQRVRTAAVGGKQELPESGERH